jgi:methyl-accepting chemotaxis protein
MTQIQRSVRNTNQAASSSAAAIDTSKALLQDTRQGVARLAAGVVSTVDETRAVLTLIETLEESGLVIERLVDAMALAGVQTTMLAVSGSVEAARAGENGRGFAAVSGDIRALAGESVVGADRAKQIVQQMRGHTGQIKRDLDQILVVMDAEIEKNRQIDARLDAVADSAGTLHGYSLEILKAAEGAERSVSEILAGVTEIATAAEESSNAAAEAGSAAHQQAQGAEDLAAAIEEIASLADELSRNEAIA